MVISGCLLIPSTAPDQAQIGVFSAVAILACGTGLVTPSLRSLVSRRLNTEGQGTALGSRKRYKAWGFSVHPWPDSATTSRSDQSIPGERNGLGRCDVAGGREPLPAQKSLIPGDPLHHPARVLLTTVSPHGDCYLARAGHAFWSPDE